MPAQPIINKPVLRLIRGGNQVPVIAQQRKSNSLDAAAIFRAIWDKPTLKKFESIYVVYLNNNSEVVTHQLLNIGNKAEAIVNKRLAVQCALADEDVVSIIIAHNHPSGNPNPSENDIELTKYLFNLFDAVDVTLADHIIITQNDYYSFRDSGQINGS